MRTYYRGPDAVITDREFIWTVHPRRAYTVDQLQNAGIVCDSRTGAPLRVLLPACALLGGVALYAGTLLGPTGLATSAGLTLLLALVVVATSGHRPRRTQHLQAQYLGRTTLIYSSSDARIFNQVARALRRTIEDSQRRRTTDSRTATAV